MVREAAIFSVATFGPRILVQILPPDIDFLTAEAQVSTCEVLEEVDIEDRIRGYSIFDLAVCEARDENIPAVLSEHRSKCGSQEKYLRQRTQESARPLWILTYMGTVSAAPP